MAGLRYCSGTEPKFGDSFYEIQHHPDPGSGCRIASEQLILTTGDKTLKLVSSDTVETGIFAGAHEDPSWESFRLHLQSWTTYRFQSRCTGTEDERRLTMPTAMRDAKKTTIMASLMIMA